MNKGIRFFVFLIGLAMLGFSSPLVFAKGGGPGGGMPSGFSKGEKKGWNGNATPPGWSQGEKKGWEDVDVPPGLSETESESKKKT